MITPVLVITAAFASVLWQHFTRRSAVEVMADLIDQDSDGRYKPPTIPCPAVELLHQGMDPLKQRRREKQFAGAGLLIAATVQFIFGTDLSRFIPGTILGGCIGYLSARAGIARDRKRWNQELEFYLPIVMERVVMAVQSGLDIVPGLQAIIELDNRAAELSTEAVSAPDPVSRLLTVVCRLTESGFSFERALREVSGKVSCPAVKHAFIHLAVAQREGGELMQPLRELSESTQLYYQDSVEEQIAKMPIKATMPLLCTFTGLIICFITPSIVQVMTTVMTEMPK